KWMMPRSVNPSRTSVQGPAWFETSTPSARLSAIFTSYRPPGRDSLSPTWAWHGNVFTHLRCVDWLIMVSSTLGVPACSQATGSPVSTKLVSQPTVKAGWSPSTHPDAPSAPSSPTNPTVRWLNLDMDESSDSLDAARGGPLREFLQGLSQTRFWLPEHDEAHLPTMARASSWVGCPLTTSRSTGAGVCTCRGGARAVRSWPDASTGTREIR